ncbi:MULTISPECIES: hypothetical protein [Nocardioides]|uniref:DUF1877 family protein n=1 Tax=Nocardioides vastitatis TaxID=2568655 RepID=A0ABW0ZEH9_9ACTN|nr:hypothetical protein [Nocardioides sp.]THI93468.1 hypothetical protein E7Z54_20955 [Nocardioides sp.]
MGVLFDYFAAPDDADAAATIDRIGGPAKPGTAAPLPARRGLFRRSPKEVETVREGADYATVADTGIDPVVQGGTLEELLTGRPYEEIEQDPRWGHSLATRDGGERQVLTLTDGLVDALAQADADRLAAVAVPWSQTEEFWGVGDPEELTSVLRALSRLAREARSRNETVYCWVCV